nr:Git1.1 [Starmerella bombicola]
MDTIEKDTGAVGVRKDPEKERRWLNTLSIACAGSALICDGYQNSLMTAINLVFKQEYPKEYTSMFSTRMSNSMTVGQIIGMLVVGLTCDLVSRKRAIVFTTLFMVLGSILATAAHGNTTQGMFWMIIVMRGVTGFGVGGEFPTSSAITLEAAGENEQLSKMRRRAFQQKLPAGGLFTLIINVPLQMGSPLCMSIFLIVWEATGGKGEHLSTVWRVMFGIGVVWPLLVFVMRIRLVTSKYFNEGKFLDLNVPWLLTLQFYWPRLLGTCVTFFLYDMIVFPNGIFSSLILKSVVKNGDTKKTAEWDLLLGALTLPGVFAGAYLCDRIGRKKTLLLGFFGFVVFGIVIGAAFEQLASIVPLFVVFYGLFQATGHMGPGSMIGLISTESYATGVRATLYGLSLAFGRAGGAIGTQFFNPIKEHWGQRWTFFVSAIIGAVAIVWAWIFLPDLDGRELACEDARLFQYLRSHGYEGQIGYVEQISPQSSREENGWGKADGCKQEEMTQARIVEWPRTDDKRTLRQRVFSMSPLGI